MQRRVVALAATFAALVLVSGGGAVTDQLETEGADNIEVEARCGGSECTFEVMHVGTRPQYFVAIDLPEGVKVVDSTASSGGQCVFEDRFALCRWRAADGGPNFPAGATRTIDLETSPSITRGTILNVCSSGHQDFEEYFCAAPEVLGAASDLELKLTAPRSTRMESVVGGDFANPIFRVVVTNNGPSTSPGGTVVLRFSRPLAGNGYYYGARWGVPQDKRITCPKTRFYAHVVVRTCRVPELHRGESAGVAVNTHATRVGVYVTRATVTGSNPDPVLANNRATRSTTVKGVGRP